MPQKILEKIIFVAGVLLFFGVFAFVSNMDYDDAVAEEQYYMKMVCEGHWPNYENLVFTCPEETN